MANIFSTEESVFFVGGTGTKAGHANPGGCSKAWYDTNFAQLSDIMGADGAPLIADADASLSEYDTNKKITRASGDFTGIEVGMVAYISDGGGEITTARYKITAVAGDKSYIYVEGLVCTGNSAGDVTINVGGAFQTLDAAIGSGAAVDATSYDVYVYDNKAETLTGVIDVVSEGSKSTGSHLYVKAFKTIPGDMDYGGSYYQSPLSAEKDGVDVDKCVEIDGDGGSYHLLDLATIYYVHFENFYFHNVGAGNYLANSGSTIEFKNCKFDQAGSAISATDYALIIDCWLGANFTNATLAPDDECRLLNNVINAAAGQNGIGDLEEGGLVIGNIFLGGAYGINCGSGYDLVVCMNNTFYNQTTACIRVYDGDGFLELNNIFMPADENGYAVVVEKPSSTVGMLMYSDFSLAYNVAGNTFAVPPWYDSENNKDLQGPNSVKDTDPKFLDAANGDFRLRVTSPCLDAGKPTSGPGFASMGACQRQQTLPALSEVAAKVLINKAVQNKATGVVDYYDDDGATVILTHTPTDGETTLTRAPS